jgi:hypothetical protein
VRVGQFVVNFMVQKDSKWRSESIRGTRTTFLRHNHTARRPAVRGDGGWKGTGARRCIPSEKIDALCSVLFGTVKRRRSILSIEQYCRIHGKKGTP